MKAMGLYVANLHMQMEQRGGKNLQKAGKINGRLTSMCRSVALVNESITRGKTVANGKCLGNDVPAAGVWFLKYI